MRKIILSLAVSLDGYIEGPKGEYDWCFMDDDYGMKDFLKRVDSLFMGRKTYELTLTAPEQRNAFRHMKNYVFSNTLKEVKDRDILLREAKAETISAIKREAGKDIWLFGGASLTAFLLEEGLIDEFILLVHPVLLGGGKRLFPPLAYRTQLKLEDSQTYPSGLVMLSYSFVRPD